MKNMSKKLIAFGFIVIAILSCKNNDEDMMERERMVLCDRPSNYDYLEQFPSDLKCYSDTCNQYFDVWKSIFLEKNILTENFFEEHIAVSRTSLNTWNDGISFRICYKFKIDWAITYNCDQFIIKINADNTLYPLLDLPRDTYLTKEKIKIAVDSRAFSSGIIKITNVGNIKYSTMDNALSDLIEFSGVNQLCLNRVSLDDDSGNLILEASAQYKNEENSCIKGTIDLVTGFFEIRDTPCWIN